MKGKYNSSAAWLEIGGKKKYFRSKMESNFAYYLEWLKNNGNIIEWQHEPCLFKLEGRMGTISHYKPDFVAVGVDEKWYWYEVKGYMDKRSQAKINAFRKQYPNLSLTVVDKKWFRDNSKKLKGLVPGWQ